MNEVSINGYYKVIIFSPKIRTNYLTFEDAEIRIPLWYNLGMGDFHEVNDTETDFSLFFFSYFNDPVLFYNIDKTFSWS